MYIHILHMYVCLYTYTYIYTNIYIIHYNTDIIKYFHPKFPFIDLFMKSLHFFKPPTHRQRGRQRGRRWRAGAEGGARRRDGRLARRPMGKMASLW
jgi:hypothetical protein